MLLLLVPMHIRQIYVSARGVGVRELQECERYRSERGVGVREVKECTNLACADSCSCGPKTGIVSCWRRISTLSTCSVDKAL